MGLIFIGYIYSTCISPQKSVCLGEAYGDPQVGSLRKKSLPLPRSMRHLPSGWASVMVSPLPIVGAF